MKHFYLIRLAGKNLFRYKRRTIITLTVLAVGIAAFILLDSLLLGARNESELALIHYEMSPARLVTPAYWEDWKNRPLEEVLPDPDGLIQALNEAGIDTAKRTEFNATAVTRTGLRGSFPLTAIALETDENRKVNRITETVLEGRLPEAGQEEAALGDWLAQDMGLSVGDELTLQMIDRWGSREAMDLVIVGLVNSPNSQINRSYLFLPHDTADYYLNLEGAAGMVLIDLPESGRDRRRTQAEAQTIAAEYGAEFHGWRDWSADYLAMAAGDLYGSAVILFLVFIIASVGLANTMLMSVMERQPEIGMMRSLGMKDSALLGLFIYEALLIGLLGSLGGIILGALGNIPMVRYGIDYTWMMRDFDIGYRFTGLVHGLWNTPSYFLALLAGLFICLTVTWLSVHKILRKPITEEIRAA
ncbi:MAG: FtsX-like permease family protein [Spirochaetales bacterium]|nr:FtsX-like permease family protein [Spirochaetales bacterium]